jgi:pimeloyl-ACP methyl ester carboxylesterase
MRARKAIIWSAAIGAVIALGASGYRADLPYAQVKASFETASSQWVDVQGASIHFTDQGNGPAIVFLHGSGADLGAYAATAVEMATLGYRVITLDLPGSGLSLAGPTTGFHNDDNVALVAAFIAERGVDPTAIIGHSTGGQIAWSLALTSPELSDRLVLIAPTGQPAKSPLTWQIAQTPVLGAMLKNVTPAFVVRQNLKDAVFDDSTISEATVARYHQLLLRDGARDALFARMQKVTFDGVENLPCIAQPTLILWGAEDVWLPAQLGDAFADAIPNATLITLPNVGHNLPEEVAPATLAAHLNDWLAQPIQTPDVPQPAHCLRAPTH